MEELLRLAHCNLQRKVNKINKTLFPNSSIMYDSIKPLELFHK
jgi:hypothetical protein